MRYELFADRAYTSEGKLVPRTEDGAVISDEAVVLKRVERLLKERTVESQDGTPLHLKADTLCVHSDTQSARDLVVVLRSLIDVYRAR